MADWKPSVPANGERITMQGGQLHVPARPILPFIEGDGTGPDIWRAAVRVFDAAVQKAYGGARQIAWMEVLAGQKAFDTVGDWLPQSTIDAFTAFLVGIKGPLTTPVGGGIRSLNVALRQTLDLYVCLRPVRYFAGVPSPVKHPDKVDMVIFRENTEDIYAGIEWAAGTPEVKKVIHWLQDQMGVKKIRFPETSAIGIKPLSKDAIADIFLQQVLTRPEEFDVIATLNLNGDYASDALAAQVGGIGIAPGGNINYDSGHAIFEATHGTAPKYADQDVVNPGSVILSGEMMLRYMGWKEAADRILHGLEQAIQQKTVTYDFHRLMEGATKVKTSEFADRIIANMG